MADSIVHALPQPHHDGPTDRCATLTQEDDSPPVLVLGSLAEPERIARLAARHELGPAELHQFARRGWQ